MRTELASPRYRDLDMWPLPDIVGALWDSQLAAVAACQPALPELSTAIEAAAARLADGTGRLVYAGAGSSGMIAVLDAREIGLTYNWPEERLALLFADGFDLRPPLQAGNEDDFDTGIAEAGKLALTEDDVVVGISASGTSAFTIAVAEEAKRCGALTLAVTSNPQSALASGADHVIAVETGAEVIAGSTRLGAGTAQKLILNTLSTALMVRLGFVHGNLMIEVRPDNRKLRNRCIAMVQQIAAATHEEAADALARHGSVKRAVLGLAGVAEPDIDPLLHSNRNSLRRALNAVRAKSP